MEDLRQKIDAIVDEGLKEWAASLTVETTEQQRLNVSLVNERDEALATLEFANRQRDQAMQENELLREALAGVRVERDEEKADALRFYRSLWKEIHASAKQRDRFERLLSKRKKVIRRLQQRIQEMAGQRNEARAELTYRGEQCDSLRAEIVSLQQRILDSAASQETVLAMARAEVERLRGKLAQLLVESQADKAWIAVAVESNRDIYTYLRSIYPALSEQYGMPVDGVRDVVAFYKRGVVLYRENWQAAACETGGCDCDPDEIVDHTHQWADASDAVRVWEAEAKKREET